MKEEKDLTQSAEKFEHTCRVCRKKYTSSEQWYCYCSKECEQKDQEEMKKREEAAKKARKQAWTRERLMQIPIKYLKIETDKKNLLSQYSKKPQSLFLWGDVGTGKTVFAASLARQYIHNIISKKEVVLERTLSIRKYRWMAKIENQIYDVIWHSFPVLLMEMQRGFYSGNQRGKDPYQIADKIAKTDSILFLDDLGAEKPTDWVRQITYYIINEREQRELITIITSNFSLSQIDSQIDSRISSRIAGMCEVIKMTGEDRRLKN